MKQNILYNNIDVELIFYVQNRKSIKIVNLDNSVSVPAYLIELPDDHYSVGVRSFTISRDRDASPGFRETGYL